MSFRVALSSSAILLALVGVGVSTAGTVAHADGLPAATSTTENDANGSVSGKSDATVKVEQGYLTLDAVPDLNFGMTAETKTANKNIPLANNQGLTNDDGNASGLLKVTDSRSKTDTETGKVTTMPWQLTATVGGFKSVSDSSWTSSPDWAIHLNQTSGTNSEGAMPQVYQPMLAAGDNAQHQVMQSTQGNGTGSTSVYYSGAKDASLDMGANVPAGQYDAPITWTLNATPNASVN